MDGVVLSRNTQAVYRQADTLFLSGLNVGLRSKNVGKCGAGVEEQGGVVWGNRTSSRKNWGLGGPKSFEEFDLKMTI